MSFCRVRRARQISAVGRFHEVRGALDYVQWLVALVGKD